MAKKSMALEPGSNKLYLRDPSGTVRRATVVISKTGKLVATTIDAFVVKDGQIVGLQEGFSLASEEDAIDPVAGMKEAVRAARERSNSVLETRRASKRALATWLAEQGAPAESLTWLEG